MALPIRPGAPVHDRRAWSRALVLAAVGATLLFGCVPAQAEVPQSSFKISGSASGLYPGKAVPLVLTVTNPLRFAITVTSLSVSVSSASRACVASDLKVPPFAGHLTVRARRSAHVTLHAAMIDGAPNACQHAHFPLRYRAVAARASS